MERSLILEIVLQQVNSLVDTFSDDQKFEVSAETRLFGQNANIDSLSLVSLIVDIESVFLTEYDVLVSLTDDRAMTRPVSPFNDVSTLVDYLDEVINHN
ncbi:MAG: hypothetical protein IPQ08_11905 [Chitinophagaceae bacterium]|nr:hypothetical protein [Chitinophagaceae bacterium]